MLTFVPEEIENYSIQHTSKLPNYLQKLIRLTQETREDAMMLSGPIEGNLLQLLVNEKHFKLVASLEST